MLIPAENKNLKNLGLKNNIKNCYKNQVLFFLSNLLALFLANQLCFFLLINIENLL